MHIRLTAPLGPLATALTRVTGCAATLNQEGQEQRTAQVIGRPIGRSIGQFAITDRSEEAGGRINDTVNTRDGAAYRCYLYGATGLQKAMIFGQTPHSDAICTAMVGGKSGSGHQAPAAQGPRGRIAGGDCSALLRAAGRC